MVAWVPSQNGLLLECPQRHSAICSGCSITWPSGATRVTGPETRYGPSSLGSIVTSGMGPPSVDLDGVVDWQGSDPCAGQRGDRVDQRGCRGGHRDLTDTRRR